MAEIIETNYDILLAMFPNIDRKYIKEVCRNPPFEVIEGDNTLEMLINHLLGYDNVPQELLMEFIEEERNRKEILMNDKALSEMLQIQDLEVIEEEKHNRAMLNEQLFSEFLQQDTVDEKMQVLINVLPDADPGFLKNFLEGKRDNHLSLEEFVEARLLNKDYETRDKCCARENTRKRIEQYTTGFIAEDFIKEFPDPFEYFEDEERQSIPQEEALDFLKMRYPNFTGENVTHIFTSTKQNLTLADKNLQNSYGNNPTIQMSLDINDIPLLQEIAFIQNKENIKSCLESIKLKEEKEMKVLRAQKLLLECQCCFDDLKPTDCIECDNDNTHIFCKKCILKGTNLAISNGQSSVRCFMGCNIEIPLNILRKVLPPNTFDKFLKKRQEAEVMAAKLDDLVTCPFCPYSMELAPQIQIFTCKSPECMKITCRLCKKINHLPIKCEDVLDEHKSRLLIEEEMSKALIRYCYNCKKPFVKLQGCNKMQCYCGAMMCYICRQPITGYDHFDHKNACKTHQNSDKYDQEQIEIRRVETTSKIRRDFPDLKIPGVQ